MKKKRPRTLDYTIEEKESKIEGERYVVGRLGRRVSHRSFPIQMSREMYSRFLRKELGMVY